MGCLRKCRDSALANTPMQTMVAPQLVFSAGPVQAVVAPLMTAAAAMPGAFAAPVQIAAPVQAGVFRQISAPDITSKQCSYVSCPVSLCHTFN